MRGGLTRRTAVASGLLALVVGCAIALLLASIAELRADERRALRSQDVLVAANHLERLILDVETGQRGFLLTGRDEFLQPWQTGRAAFGTEA